MSYLKLITCKDKLRTVPEAGCRLYGTAIHYGSDKERRPAKYIVYQSKLFHYIFLFIISEIIMQIYKETNYNKVIYYILT